MKAIMIEQALPFSLWVKAYEEAIFIANLYALGNGMMLLSVIRYLCQATQNHCSGRR